MRVVIMAAVVLICWSRTAPLSAIEFVALRFSCSYVGNEVALVPSAADRLHVVVSDRTQKIIRVCAPGSTDKCRSWTVHRFDLLCGERKTSWHMIAEQLLHLTPVPAGTGSVSVRVALEPWELRALRAESGFAPVDELGGRIFSFADMPTLEVAASRRVSDVNIMRASEIVSRTPPSPKSELDPALASDDLPKDAAGTQSSQAATGQARSANLISQQPGVLSARKPDAVEGRAAIALDPARPKQELDLAAANLPNPQIASRVSSFITKFAPQRWDGEQIGRFLIVLATILLLTFVFMTIAHIALGRKLVFGSRVGSVDALRARPEAEACHELMKQIASELMRATSAVNSLQNVPALQSALSRELDSIKRPLGPAPQSQGNSGEKGDWYRIKLQLIACLRGTQRIIDIAEAARASLSLHPAPLQDVTTRGEAYAFLGVNATSSEAVLKKTVNALRLCWHPDLATDDADRDLRETRTKQINVAWDLISGKRMSAC